MIQGAHGRRLRATAIGTGMLLLSGGAWTWTSAAQAANAGAEGTPRWERTCRTDALTGEETDCRRKTRSGAWKLECREGTGIGASCTVRSAPGRIEEGPRGQMTLRMLCSMRTEYDPTPVVFGAMAEGFPDYRSEWTRLMQGYSYEDPLGRARFLAPGMGEPIKVEAKSTLASNFVLTWFKGEGAARKLYEALAQSRTIRMELSSSALIGLWHDSPLVAFDLTGSRRAFELALQQPECVGAAESIR